MNYELLPIGTVIETEEEIKYIISGYTDEGYFCSKYPMLNLEDLIPPEELMNKYNYKCFTDNNIKYNTKFKIIHMGYKNNDFEELSKNIINNIKN